MLRLFLMSFLTCALAGNVALADPKPESKPAAKPAVAAPKIEKVDWRKQLPAKKDVAGYLQEISVTIKASHSEGSGVVKTRLMKIDGKEVKINFVWTAAHVVDHLRSVKEVIDPKTGTKREVVQFKDAEVVKELVESGRRVGELKMDAEVIKFNQEQDLALLRIRKKDFVAASVVFYLDEKSPQIPIGTDVYHVGSLLGQMGSNSMTSGIISQIGRIIDKREFDQSTATAFPGSSGGGLFLKNEDAGAYIGMLVRGAGEGFNLMVPIRRIRAWAVKAKIEWALDDNVAMPTEEQIQKLPVEDIGIEFGVPAAAGEKPSMPTPAPMPPAAPASIKSLEDCPPMIHDSSKNPKPRTEILIPSGPAGNFGPLT